MRKARLPLSFYPFLLSSILHSHIIDAFLPDDVTLDNITRNTYIVSLVV